MPIFHRKMVLGIAGILVLVHLTRPEELEFLIEGETIEFTQQIRTDRLTIITIIDIDTVSGREQINEIDTILKGWNNYPAFNGQTPDISVVYLSLTEKAVEDIIRAATLLDIVVLFRDQTNDRNATYSCVYTHDVLIERNAVASKQLKDNIQKTGTKLDSGRNIHGY